jgi:hypothetical protein
MGLQRTQETGAHVGEVLFVNAGRLGADAGVRVFGLRLRGAPVLLRVKSYAGAHSRRAKRPSVDSRPSRNSGPVHG